MKRAADTDGDHRLVTVPLQIPRTRFGLVTVRHGRGGHQRPVGGRGLRGLGGCAGRVGATCLEGWPRRRRGRSQRSRRRSHSRVWSAPPSLGCERPARYPRRRAGVAPRRPRPAPGESLLSSPRLDGASNPSLDFRSPGHGPARCRLDISSAIGDKWERLGDQ